MKEKEMTAPRYKGIPAIADVKIELISEDNDISKGENVVGVIGTIVSGKANLENRNAEALDCRHVK